MGGLGNQMFQYALGRRLSLIRNVPLKADCGFLQTETDEHVKREYGLGIFNLNISIANKKELDKFSRKIHGILPFLWPYYVVNESKHSYDDNVLNAHKNSYLNGFWQTEKYFKPIEEIIRKDFAFKPITDSLNKATAEKIRSVNAVSVHVRRGDYVSNKNTNEYHGTCGIDYYSQAADIIKQKAGDPHFFIFSDDIDWVKQNLNFGSAVTYVENNKGANNYIDMQLMSLCKHNIIANSSFSWWGAWLNSSEQKVVVAPGKWFNQAALDTSDVIPQGWIKI